MPKGNPKGGRPLILIDWESFDKLCALHCTLVEISEWFNCSEDTIERAVKREKLLGFAEYFKRKSSKGKTSLRRAQYELAMKGNCTMLIWLGKQHLEQSDKYEAKEELKVENKVVYTSSWGSSKEVKSDK